MKGDYHIHTYYSDGVFSPEKIVDLALDAGLQAIALTDHDNVLSYNVAKEYLKTKEVDLKLIQGIEVNTLYKDYEVHILGYFPDVNKSIKIKYEDVKNMVAEGGSIGRPHIAKAITNAGGTSNVMEAYSKYIHRQSPVYVERKTVTPFDAVEVIYDAGGIPVIAHPYDIDIAEKLIKNLMNCGLRGIEAYHRKHSPAIVEYFSSMAESLGLIVTGGSDFHAPNIMNGQIILGKNFVPEWIYDTMVQEKKRLEMAG